MQDYAKSLQNRLLASKGVIPCDLHVYFDLETTGLKVGTAEIIELAAVVDPYWATCTEKQRLIKLIGTKSFQFESLIKNRKPLNEEALKVNKISQEMLNKKGRDMDEVIQDFFTWITSLVATEPATVYITAYNGHKFDGKMLEHAVQNSNVQIPSGVHFFVADSYKAVCEVLKNEKKKEKMSLEAVYNRMVKPGDKKVQTHRAMDDTTMQIDVVESFNSAQKIAYYKSLRSQAKLLDFTAPYKKEESEAKRKSKQ
jgi:DNA polymerase III epsilon subunit-like protein